MGWVEVFPRYKDKVKHIDEKTEKRQKQQEEKEKQLEAATEELGVLRETGKEGLNTATSKFVCSCQFGGSSKETSGAEESSFSCGCFYPVTFAEQEAGVGRGEAGVGRGEPGVGRAGVQEGESGGWMSGKGA